MIITSVVLLAGAVVLLVVGVLQGSPQVLGMSLGAAAAGALSLLAGNASARRMAIARGVPVEAVLAARVRRTPTVPTHEASNENNRSDTSQPPPPIDGYDEMPSRDLVRLVSSGVLPDADLSDMLAYEASHQRRREVLTAIMDVVGPEPAPASRESESPRRRSSGGARPASETLRATRKTTPVEE